MPPVNRSEPLELPRLSVAIRRMSHLSGSKEQFSSSGCCSLEQKRAYMAGCHSSDRKLMSTSSLWGKLCQLLPQDSTLETRMTMEKLFQQYSDSCVDLLGRDTTDPGDLSAFMTLLCFGHLGPKFFELFDRGVSKEDFPRHSSIQKERPAILRKMGGTGAKNIQESWNKMCICLVSLITHRLFLSTRDCVLDLMRKCRVAVESDSSFALTLDNSGVQKTVVNSAAVGFQLDWEGAKVIHQSVKEKSSRLLQMLFARNRSSSAVETDHLKCNSLPSAPGDSAATEALKLALSLPLAAPRVHDEPIVSSVKAVDLTVLFEELSPKAASLGIPLNELMDMVFISLGSSRSSDVVQNELCELIGWDCIDLVFALLRERSAWVTTYQSRNDPENFVEQKHTRIAPPISGEEPKSLVQQLIHDPISVAAARAAQLEANARATAARLQQVMASGPSASTKAAEFKRSLPFVYDQLAELRERVAFVDCSRPRLPTGTTYKQLPLWDEFQFPIPTNPPSSVLDVPRVQVASLDSIGQRAFAGMQELNLIQSVVYPVAYHTAENLLVSAPTGAGKTNVAMLAIVQLLRSHLTKDSVLDLKSFKIEQQAFAGMQELNLIQSVVYPVAYHTAENLLVSAPTGAGKTNVAMLAIVQLLRSHLTKDSVLDLKSFKIVYLAPMKALAAELATTFAKRLAPLGLKVRECTGDMQLSKQEILETQMLVSTPEKWDVISRKGSGDATLVTLVKLLIIDEIHLLHEDRGAVIEVLVARTLRQVETSQTLIRLVGLSATLPNYEDVAHFLHVNPYRGLFYFDDRFRPVPLRMSFYGVRGSNRRVQEANMNAACYELLLEQVKRGEQVMVFVHARGDTVKTARWLCDTAHQQQQIVHFQVPEKNDRSIVMKRIDRCGDMALRELLPFGFACHHAGMLRQDRTLVERLFADGHVRTLVCTATLAWGVNLPAHAVIIKGTRVYKAEKSDFVELDILDVLQIFGRAGRPQFDTQGVASIITSIDKLDHYLRLITNQHPIESSLLSNLNDHLNAEIALGTVTNIDDAVTWLKDTYLFVRLMKNPLHYGIQTDLSNSDSALSDYLGRVVRSSALDLDAAEMIRYEPQTGQLASTDRGRTASLFYIRFSTAAMVRDTLEPTTMLPQLFSVLSEASEFVAMKVRDEEGGELNNLKGSFCRVPIQKAGNVDSDVPAKVNALLQGYISRHSPVCHSLASDMNYIHQNAGRLVRYLFEISLRQGWSSCASTTLLLARMIEQRQWDGQTPLWQFAGASSHRLLQRVDEMDLSVDRIRETEIDELTHLLRFRGRDGAREVSQLAALVPRVQLTAEIQPITRTILRVRMTLEPDFTWSDRSHGTQQNFWIWIEDPDQGLIYHSEYWTLTKRTFKSKEPSSLVCTIPLFEPFPAQYLVRVNSDHWLGADTVCPLSFKRLLLPPSDPPHTDLLNLEPLPVCALQNSQYELLYKFTHFNPIQTQIFHTLYHQDVNVLLGAPTGSGKTVAAELAIFRVFNETPNKKCVYIAPLKALVRE
ncbi:hypothetical protein P879_05251 [Paragonimus westermani]|uniref:Activating signal cointegrator 1 complex subunit 3 n=1 Tax=Paragonimus westermani TaxID=34504 RepID=A0A8T0DNE8_9TREM|nr:hypothetical protein P879_05251 [Paragonimus westermani]